MHIWEAAVVGRGCSTKDKVFYKECETHNYGDSLEKMCFCSFHLCNRSKPLNCPMSLWTLLTLLAFIYSCWDPWTTTLTITSNHSCSEQVKCQKVHHRRLRRLRRRPSSSEIQEHYCWSEYIQYIHLHVITTQPEYRLSLPIRFDSSDTIRVVRYNIWIIVQSAERHPISSLNQNTQPCCHYILIRMIGLEYKQYYSLNTFQDTFQCATTPSVLGFEYKQFKWILQTRPVCLDDKTVLIMK